MRPDTLVSAAFALLSCLLLCVVAFLCRERHHRALWLVPTVLVVVSSSLMSGALRRTPGTRPARAPSVVLGGAILSDCPQMLSYLVVSHRAQRLLDVVAGVFFVCLSSLGVELCFCTSWWGVRVVCGCTVGSWHLRAYC